MLPNQARPAPPLPGRSPATVLIVSPVSEDHAVLSSIFQRPYWKTYWARNYHEALTWLIKDRMAVIICESRLSDGDWKDILSQTQVLPDPPCLIVASGLADDVLWTEVLSLGGFDVLAKPFVREEVVAVAEIAAMKWKHAAAAQSRIATPAPRKAPQQEVSMHTEDPGGAAPRARAARASGGS